MKKILCLILVLVLAFAACGQESSESGAHSESSLTSSAEENMPTAPPAANPPEIDENTPIIDFHDVGFEEGEEISEIAFLLDSSVLLTTYGNVYSWGHNIGGELGLGFPLNTFVAMPQKVEIGEPIVDINGTTNGDSVIALSESGELYAWGGNSYYIYDSREKSIASPKKIEIDFKPVAIDGAFNSFLAQSPDGTLYRCGGMAYYDTSFENEISHSENEVHKEVYKIDMPENVSVASFFDTETHMGFISEDGEVFVIGLYEYVAYYEEATKIDFPQKIKKVAPLYDSIVALGEDGILYFYGHDVYGVYRSGPEEEIKIEKPAAIEKGIGKITDIWSSRSAIVVKNELGEIFTWGYNMFRQCYDGKENEMIYEPQRLELPNNISDVFCGVATSAAKAEDGSIYMWGSNYDAKFLDPRHPGGFKPVKVW